MRLSPIFTLDGVGLIAILRVNTIGLNYRELPKYALPLEKEFGGSFIGFVRKFRFYGCDVSFSDIVKNAVFDGTF